MNSIANIKEEAFKIGKWSFYPEYGRFVNLNGDEFFVDNRLNRLFQVLIKKRGSILKRNDIIDYVWNEVHVNEENLTKGIFDLRKLFKDKGITELEIITFRNIGYQLIVKEDGIESKSLLRKKLILNTLLYTFMLLSFLIMFIRAIRYEN